MYEKWNTQNINKGHVKPNEAVDSKTKVILVL